jgi:UPF0271 protein
MRTSIDLNCDLGEGCPNDAELMRFISSANIACGFHAGDANTMKQTVELAIENGVALGAHPSFPDRQNFGRTNMSLPYEEVTRIVGEQISALGKICDEQGTALRHVKPHGALYNMAAKDRELAAAIASAVSGFDPDLIFVGPPNSFMISEAEALGLSTASEVFADRTYQPDGSLTPRSQPNALIENIDECIEHVLRMIREEKVIATEGTPVRIKADTICIHGDGEHAVEFARAINDALRKEEINIQPPLK